MAKEKRSGYEPKLHFNGECMLSFKEIEKEAYGVESHIDCGDVKICKNNIDNWDEIVSSAWGFDLPIIANIPAIPDLPKLIHSFDNETEILRVMNAIDDVIFAFPFNTVIAGNMDYINRIREWRKNKKILKTKIFMLHEEKSDVELGRLDYKISREGFFDMIKMDGRCLCISPGYSVYDDGSMCRHIQLLNLKKSLTYFEKFCNYGIPCIPMLGWNSRSDIGDKDINRIVDWINAHLSLRYVAINMQTIRTKKDREIVIRDLMDMESKSRCLNWVVFGGPEHVLALSEAGFQGRLHLVTSAHVHSAKNKHAAKKQQGNVRFKDTFIEELSNLKLRIKDI